jgi:hypothetical protein
MGIEPTCTAWEAVVLPLNYARMKRDARARKAARLGPEIFDRRVQADGMPISIRGKTTKQTIAPCAFQGILTAPTP